MQSFTVLLNSNENTRKVEEEEKSRFIKSIIEAMNVPMEDVWDEDGELSIEQRIKIRKVLSDFNIRVLDYPGGELEIYVDNDLVAKWHKCEYVLKRDLAAIDPSKKLYLEMKINYWSMFDSNN